jgi:hypothetical protein
MAFRRKCPPERSEEGRLSPATTELCSLTRQPRRDTTASFQLTRQHELTPRSCPCHTARPRDKTFSRAPPQRPAPQLANSAFAQKHPKRATTAAVHQLNTKLFEHTQQPHLARSRTRALSSAPRSPSTTAPSHDLLGKLPARIYPLNTRRPCAASTASQNLERSLCINPARATLFLCAGVSARHHPHAPLAPKDPSTRHDRETLPPRELRATTGARPDAATRHNPIPRPHAST